MGRLLLLFILVPAVELAILIEIGSRIGTLPTLVLIVSTGALGAFLARVQGLSVLRAAHDEMERGELPAGSLVDGVLILVAAALLVTPGVLTDAAGFLLLVPRARTAVKGFLLRRFRRAVEERRIRVNVAGFGDSPRSGPAYEWRQETFESLESIDAVDPDPDSGSTSSDDTPKYRIH
jgi:UPF0716 protein FxsA